MNSELLDSTTPTNNLVERGNKRTHDKAYTCLKVSQAAIKTRKPFWMSQKQTLDRLVLFPTPLTPTNTMLYGTRCWEEVRGEESFVRIDNSRSVEVLGVRILVSEVDNAARTALFVARV